MMMINGESVKQERIRHFLLYETHSGAIKHVYTVLTFSGATEMSEDHHWVQAKKIAERHGSDLSKLEHVIVEDIEHPIGKHKYDSKTKTLIPI